MAAFATFTAAETRAVAKVADKTWIVAHAQRNFSGVLSVYVQRKMGAGAALLNGGWVTITDDGTV